MSRDSEQTEIPRFKERRRWPRKQGLKSGRITYGRSGASMVCMVLDTSEGGARLIPADLHLCPNHFSLRIAGEPTRRCTVVWRERKQMGVKFV